MSDKAPQIEIPTSSAMMRCHSWEKCKEKQGEHWGWCSHGAAHGPLSACSVPCDNDGGVHGAHCEQMGETPTDLGALRSCLMHGDNRDLYDHANRAADEIQNLRAQISALRAHGCELLAKCDEPDCDWTKLWLDISCRCPCIVAIREHIDAGAEIAPEILAAAGFCEDARLASVDLPRAQFDIAALRQLLRDLRPYVLTPPWTRRRSLLERAIEVARSALTKSSEARRRLPAGSSRDRVTTANARASTAAEALDRLLDLQRRYEEAA